ncbi:transcriptional regulator [Cohnella sp. REN36]|uniref:ArsR/SmtB family transcription factor n=1 Tax=Cohnella sp. REN36 TaxID=2887347 RepID=UPI001D15DD76|nr:helix-turn-helix domain-containing protein [Cohnella sp. REN36]MCC3373724.1 helix-turn-helix domain-containing protein [Cohnella sp. REN36]
MLELSINEPEELAKVAHALSSPTRLSIIKLLLKHYKLNVIEIADLLQIPVSTAATNIKVLEDTALILTELQPASRGAMKVCRRNFDDVHMILNPIAGYRNPNQTYFIEMPIGHFSDFEVYPTCGMANPQRMIIPEDDPSSFYHPECKTAEIIWFRQGWIQYRFPKVLPVNARIQSIEFKMELCSEAPNYNNDWPSDITFWVNGVEVGTWKSPGDFGDHRGKYNPPWWNDTSTQYGILKSFRVDDQRSTLDNERVSGITLAELGLESSPFISLRIGIKPDAAHKGGVNLFGRGFGDHDQSITMNIQYLVE